MTELETLTEYAFNADPTPGLTDVLSGTHAWGDVACEVDESGLFAIHSGSGTDNPAALLESPAFGELLLGLKEEFDLVVIDVPPILAVADSAAFLHDLDGVLLLARARACTMEVLQTARDRLRRVGANLLGTVFNGFDARLGESAYGYYGRAYEETKAPARRPAPQLAGNGRRG